MAYVAVVHMGLRWNSAAFCLPSLRADFLCGCPASASSLSLRQTRLDDVMCLSIGWCVLIVPQKQISWFWLHLWSVKRRQSV